MNLTNYITTSEDFSLISRASDVGASRALLKAAKVKRDALRKENEEYPMSPEVVLNLGEIRGLNFILDLPGKANDYIKDLEGD